MQEQRGSMAQAYYDRSSSKAAAPVFMSAEELQKHPEFPYVTWDLSPTKKGNVAAARDRGGPINIAYEVHGHGPAHLVVSFLHNCRST